MQKDLKINTAKRDGREIKYMKKFNGEMKKFKIFKRIVLIISALILIFIITFLYKYAILLNIQKSFNISKNKQNIYYTKQDGISFIEYYKKGYKQKIVHYSIEGDNKKISGIDWSDLETNENLFISPNIKTYYHRFLSGSPLRQCPN